MRRILIQLDTDNHPSSFDSVVAIDAGVDQLLRYENVGPTSLTPIVHGAMFTRGGSSLASTAIFLGGSNVDDAEDLLAACQKIFFGPVRVSVMLDANGCNTTAAAAVVCAARQVNLSASKAVVLGGTGPVGRRVGQLLASDGATVTLTSRSKSRADQSATQINETLETNLVIGASVNNDADADEVAADADILIGCGAAGIELIDENSMSKLKNLKVAIDLNAVPPAGIAGVDAMDKAKPIGNQDALAYGAIGVGGLKMKTHRAAIESLFESNDKILDAAEIYELAKQIDAKR